MSDEIQATVGIAYRRPASVAGGRPLEVNVSQVTMLIDQSVEGARIEKVVAIATGTGTQLDLSGMTNPGVIFLSNNDALIAVDVGRVDGGTFRAFLHLAPGRGWPYEMPSGLTSLWFKSASGTPVCYATVYER